MRFVSLNLRMLMRASGIALLGLLCASMANAAPAPARGVAGPICDPQTPTHRKLPRHPKSFGGPLADRSDSSRGVVKDLSARLQRGLRTNLAGDDVAIQNDAPATQIDADDGPIPALRPLGLLIGSLDLRLETRAFSPRSPRGPPFPA
jgi:hypothetical protein